MTLFYFNSEDGKRREKAPRYYENSINEGSRRYSDTDKHVWLLGDDKNSLYHLDLNHPPRTIMPNIHNDTLSISDILGWDNAISAPRFSANIDPAIKHQKIRS